jgi:hypothetical protein
MNKQSDRAGLTLNRERELDEREYRFKKPRKTTSVKTRSRQQTRKITSQTPDKLLIQVLYFLADRINEILLVSIVGFALLTLFLIG